MPVAQVAISAVTETELRFGIVRKAESSHLRLTVEEFLRRIEILEWGSAAARHYAVFRHALEESGTPMGNLDLMIAAQALAADATLVTHDRVFHRIKSLRIEDWTKPI